MYPTPPRTTRLIRHLTAATLLLLTTAIARAQSPVGPIPIDKAPTKTGSFQVTLTERSPLSKPADVALRTSQKITPADADYDLSKETFETFVPKSPGDDGKYGLMVVMPFPGHAFVPHAWLPVLEKHHLLWLGDNAAGDGRSPLHRIGLALDAVHNAQKVWPIDPARIYVCPASNGPVACGIGLYYPEVFQGQLCAASYAWYAKITDPRTRGAWDTDRFPRPRPEQFGLAKSRSRFFFACREGRAPNAADGSEVVAKEGYQRAGFAHVKFIVVPQAQITVWSVYPESWFEQGIEYFDSTAADAADAKPAPIAAAKPSTAPTAAPAPAPADDPAKKSAAALSLAKSYITAGQFAPARSKLQNIIQSYPTTPAAAEAKALLKDIQDK